ncbi:MAG TPA: hypothetical protein VG714_09165 [Acidobacteriaceae bacterium]|nr:hypothetical protein [Acidobacteriaceae bacterium]
MAEGLEQAQGGARGEIRAEERGVWVRRLLPIYVVLLVLCGIGYAKYSSYLLDGDAVSFMDIADAMRAHKWGLVANGYWNPAYSAVLALAEMVAHPTRWTELGTFYWANFWVFLGCIAACLFFVRSLARLRDRRIADDGTEPALSGRALQLAALAIMFWSFQRELSLGAVRSDSLLLFFLLLAAGLLLRILAGGGWALYPLLGVALGCAYLTKSFAFVASGALLLGLLLWGLRRKDGSGTLTRGRVVAGTIAAGIVFAALAAPYVIAISKQRGRPTTGESARMNYAFFVDGTARWHEFHTGKLGHATANFKHPEQLLLEWPPVYSYARHPLGTYPLWFDPSYWTDEIQPHIWIKGEALRMARNVVLLVRFVVGHLEPVVLLAALLAAGCFFPKRRVMWLPLVAAAVWGLLMLGIYFPVDLQDRYLTGAFLFVVVTALAVMRRRDAGAGRAATALVVLLALLAVADAASDLGERRRLLSVTTHHGGAYSPEIYGAAQGLNKLGIGGDEGVACFGDIACYLDPYWARLAETPVRAEVEVPDGGDPGRFWAAQTDQAQVVAALRAQGIHAIVASFAPSAHIPEGWQQLGMTNFYAYVIPQS